MNLLSSGYKTAIAALLLLSCKLYPTAYAQPVEQATIEAAMTLQLLSFTEWPADVAPEGTTLRIGVFGTSAHLDAFRALVEDQRYRQRYELMTVNANTIGEQLETLHAIFFGKPDPAEIPRIIRRLEGMPVVLIGAHDGFLEQGGMVNLVKRQRRLGFEIHVLNSRNHGIEYRAKLLRLATRIIDE